jgi:hypothetical protein
MACPELDEGPEVIVLLFHKIRISDPLKIFNRARGLVKAVGDAHP